MVIPTGRPLGSPEPGKDLEQFEKAAEDARALGGPNHHLKVQGDQVSGNQFVRPGSVRGLLRRVFEQHVHLPNAQRRNTNAQNALRAALSSGPFGPGAVRTAMQGSFDNRGQTAVTPMSLERTKGTAEQSRYDSIRAFLSGADRSLATALENPEIVPLLNSGLVQRPDAATLGFLAAAKNALSIDPNDGNELNRAYAELRANHIADDAQDRIHIAEEVGDILTDQPADQAQAIRDAMIVVEVDLGFHALISDYEERVEQDNREEITNFKGPLVQGAYQAGFHNTDDNLTSMIERVDISVARSNGRFRLTEEMKAEVTQRFNNWLDVERFTRQLAKDTPGSITQVKDVVSGYSPRLATGAMALNEQIMSEIKQRLDNRISADRFRDELEGQGHSQDLVRGVIRRLAPGAETGELELSEPIRDRISNQIVNDRQEVRNFFQQHNNAPGIEAVLRENETVLAHFGAHAQRTFAGENYEFYIAATRALEIAGQNQDLFDAAFDEIRERFILEDSARALNIGRELSGRYFDQSQDRGELISQTLQEIKRVLGQDTLPRFQVEVVGNYN